MTSHPPAECCLVGVKHEGKATGQVKNVGGTDAYFSYPKDKSTENAVLILPDGFGVKFHNTHLIADQFAANGYLCTVVDIMQSDPIPEDAFAPGNNFDLMGWVGKHPAEKVDPVIAAFMKELQNSYGVKRLGLVGYCFGGKYVARHLDASTKPSICAAGYMAHPSFVTADELKAITAPLSISAAENDQIFPADKRHETEGILMGLCQGEMKLNYQLALYGGVSHGFAVRGDLSDERCRVAKEAAFLQAVQWFDFYVKGIK